MWRLSSRVILPNLAEAAMLINPKWDYWNLDSCTEFVRAPSADFEGRLAIRDQWLTVTLLYIEQTSRIMQIY